MDFYTPMEVKEIAKILDVNVADIYHCGLGKGKIERFKSPGGNIAYKLSDIQAWAEKHSEGKLFELFRRNSIPLPTITASKIPDSDYKKLIVNILNRQLDILSMLK